MVIDLRDARMLTLDGHEEKSRAPGSRRDLLHEAGKAPKEKCLSLSFASKGLDWLEIFQRRRILKKIKKVYFATFLVTPS